MCSRFAHEANNSIQDVDRAASTVTAALLHFLPAAQIDKALEQLPSDIRAPLVSQPIDLD